MRTVWCVAARKSNSNRGARSKPARKRAAPAKAAAKKKAAKKAATKKARPKKAAAKKTATKKSAARKPAAKKTVPKKPTVKKAGTQGANAAKTVQRQPRKSATSAAEQRAAASAQVRSEKLAAFSAYLDEHTAVVQARDNRNKEHDLPLGSPTQRSQWLLDVPFEDRETAKWGGARWNPELRRWTYRGATLPRALQPWSSSPHSWERWLQEEINGFRSESASNSGGVKLRDHQVEAADAICDAWNNSIPGFLLADQVGLGKTYSTIDGVNRCGRGLNVLVLCPLSVVHHWRRSIDAMGDGGNRWCVINYDRAKALLEAPESAKSAVRQRTKNKRMAQQGRGIVAWDIVIADESHRLKNPQSQRSAAVRQIVNGHGENAFVLWLSATAGQNPLELAYLAPLLAWRTGQKAANLDDFEAWCRELGLGVKRGSFGSWEWERNEDDLHMMRKLLFTGHPVAGMRRRPEDLQGWPEMQRIPWPIALERGARRLYDDAWDEFREQLALTPSGKDSHNALVAALRFRQKASLLRVEETVAHAQELLAEGLQVAISVQFLETAEAIAARLEGTKAPTPCARVTGAQGSAEREQERIAFQQGSKPVCIFTVVEGISLHAGEQAVQATDAERALIVHDLRWSALEMAQIEGRCHRDGQNAVAYYVFAEDTVEERVAKAVLGRLTDMGSMLGDDTVGLDALLNAVS